MMSLHPRSNLLSIYTRKLQRPAPSHIVTIVQSAFNGREDDFANHALTAALKGQG